MRMFIDRKEELKELMKISKSKKPELVIIYGRRRVGKSRLLVEFTNRVNALYLLADLSKNILDILSAQIGDKFVKFNSWEDFFEFIYKSEYDIVIIDEFQYLYNIDKAWLTILQRWWEKIREKNKKIILCGSIISTIYRISKGYGSALYGRKTHEIQVKPLKFIYIMDFFPYYNSEELIKAYSVLGGIPRYLEEFDPKLSVNENIREKILDKTSFLYNEPMNLLFEEFRDPSPYVSILLAIVQGYSRFNEIAGVSRIESHKLPKYLLTLERVDLIEKEIPVTEKKIKVKTTRYRIRDNFYRFWFSFVFGNKSMIELGLEDDVFIKIKRELNSYVGKCFEDLCREILFYVDIFKFTRVGRWWHRDKEIDIIALNEHTKEILFAECKWQNNINAARICKELVEKSEYVDWNKNDRREYLAVFAKSFSKRIDTFKGRRVYCFDTDSIKKLLYLFQKW